MTKLLIAAAAANNSGLYARVMIASRSGKKVLSYEISGEELSLATTELSETFILNY